MIKKNFLIHNYKLIFIQLFCITKHYFDQNIYLLVI